MSLINEALKKAQQERPEMPMAPPPGGPVPPHPPHAPHGKKKPRGFLWGFLLALVIVGSVSSLLAAYLVLQLIDPKPQTEDSPAPVVAEAPARDDESVEDAAVQALEKAVPEGTVDASETELPSKTVSVSEKVAPTEEPLPVEPAPVSETVAEIAIEAPEPVIDEVEESAPPDVRKPDLEVITRLQQLEIRGIMSGATKALIHDLSTGRTKAYQEGESLEGSLGLTIVKISQNSLSFKDYAGHTHTKSF